MKYLVIARRAEGGYDAWVPRLPDCRARGATLEEATAKVEAELRSRLAATAADNGVVEVIVAEDVRQERKQGDGLDDEYNRLARDFDPLELETLFDLDEKQLIPFEDVIRELESSEQQGANDGTSP